MAQFKGLLRNTGIARDNVVAVLVRRDTEELARAFFEQHCARFNSESEQAGSSHKRSIVSVEINQD